MKINPTLIHLKKINKRETPRKEGLFLIGSFYS